MPTSNRRPDGGHESIAAILGPSEDQNPAYGTNRLRMRIGCGTIRVAMSLQLGKKTRRTGLLLRSSGTERADRDDGDAIWPHVAVPGTGDDCQGCRRATVNGIDAFGELKQ